MRESDCLILPSVQEGISNVVLESMAIGLPIISSDCGGMKKVLMMVEMASIFFKFTCIRKIIIKSNKSWKQRRGRIIRQGQNI